MERGEDGGYGRNRRGEDPDSYILYILYSILFSFSILPLSRLCPSFISFSILKFDWSCATGQAAGDGEGRLLHGEQRLLLACGAHSDYYEVGGCFKRGCVTVLDLLPCVTLYALY